MCRMPVPYNSRASKPVTPSIKARTLCTSSRVSTDGIRLVGTGRPISSIQGSSCTNTSLYK